MKTNKNLILILTIAFVAISVVAHAAGNPFTSFEDKGTDFIENLLKHVVSVIATVILIGACIGFMAGKVRYEMFGRIFLACFIAGAANELIVYAVS